MPYSAKLYVKIAKQDIAMFRFLLEAHENLGLMSVVDPRVAWLKIRFSEDQKQEMLLFLNGIKESLALEIKQDL
ncbi:DUF4911 domain-containing protein [Desulfovibrio litoralis]|uniref:DUF4911 domain-containing protein n=1 Tax=Desulfovibrio litoralis DSM 11393 TaxID=1121455 RepID=A0A1M7S7R9_9BACT|nr:DUF4911 domain-containing protein [Desulfovibrio litoralis]SHN54362.1 protein of unknown function [Desulfovibrio litoralis DSM 11393]